jgi:hypothetical protein
MFVKRLARWFQSHGSTILAILIGVPLGLALIFSIVTHLEAFGTPDYYS